MLANLLLPLLLVACGQAQQPPDSSPGRSVAVDWPAMQTMAVDTAGACNCACAKTATVSVAYQTKYNACVGRADRHRLCNTAATGQALPLPARLLQLLPRPLPLRRHHLLLRVSNREQIN